jgi:hypothetical protein
MVLSAVQREELPKVARSNPGAQPGAPIRAKSPSAYILSLALPRLVPTNQPPRTSARVCLVAPPPRDDFASRTNEQNRIYAEWLFDSSSHVQRCLTRAVAYCSETLLTAADELLVITKWIVSYMHQLGILPFHKEFSNCRIELLQPFKT